MLSDRKNTVILGLVVLVCAVLLVVGARRMLERQRQAVEVERLRQELYEARVAARRCQRGLSDGQRALEAFRSRLDSTRVRIDSFEALDSRGVPITEYEAYMLAFSAHNDSVAAWEQRAGKLRIDDETCRRVIVGHNAIRDTLRAAAGDIEDE